MSCSKLDCSKLFLVDLAIVLYQKFGDFLQLGDLKTGIRLLLPFKSEFLGLPLDTVERLFVGDPVNDRSGDIEIEVPVEEAEFIFFTGIPENLTMSNSLLADNLWPILAKDNGSLENKSDRYLKDF